ncbi:hypothetical protein BCR42DRAFT_402629 [Absidia repens]|uniref:Uncharacterized protein n=1 Tax=Absidia repens TaxID=90262 RepID=A0A1X2IY96_9FUNG|nr:hypothetical protein BCR42DRAFT_402629 [Absidia repens]
MYRTTRMTPASSSPQHPGGPLWKKFSDWNKTQTPSSMTMPLSAKEEQQDLLNRFKLQDDSNQQDAWGQVDLHPNTNQGWGTKLSTNNDNGGWGSTGGGGGW